MGEPTARQRLTEAAFELFAERGYDATSVDDIAARAGVGRSTFFRLFRSKEHVVFPDHEQLLDELAARLRTATTHTVVVAVSEAAGLVLRRYLDEGERARSRYRLTRSVPALRERERASIRQYERLFSAHLHRWLGGEPETLLRAELTANAVVTAHNHVLRAWLRGQVEARQEALRQFHQAMEEVDAYFGGGARLATGTTDPEAQAAVLVIRDVRDLDGVMPTIRRLLDSGPGGRESTPGA